MRRNRLGKLKAERSGLLRNGSRAYNCGLAIAMMLAAGMLSGCSGKEENPAEDSLAEVTAEWTAAAQATADSAVEGMFTDRDLSGEYDTEDAVYIRLEDESITITEEGVYILSGKLNEGMVTVDGDKNAKIQLVLNDVEISNSRGAAIYIKQADKVFITLPEGTENTLSGGDSYESLDGNNIDGIIFAKSDLTVNGAGSLNITAATGHGIVSKDDLKVTGGSLTVTAPGHGLSGKDSVRIGGSAEVLEPADSIENSGLSGENSTLAPTLHITAGKDGIHADNAEKEDKGFVYIAGGSMEITAGDDGIHAEKTVTVAGGTINIATCYEGIEGKDVVISGGSIRLYATDDGLNAAGEGSSSIMISGGTLYVNADGDGIDSNGDLKVTGGEIYISGPESSANGAIDYEGTAQITGGRLAALGASGMAMNFGESSTQGTALVNTAGCKAGTEVSLMDEAGNVLLSYTAESGFNSLVVSCPEMVQGGKYIVHVGSEEYEITLEELVYGKGFGGFGGGMRPGPGRREDGEWTGMPGDGERPEWPEAGERPEWSEDGERPEMPGGGEMPWMPGNGERPEWPGAGERPEMPGGGERPEMPGDGERPEMPGNGERPEMPEAGEEPDMPTDGEIPVKREG